MDSKAIKYLLLALLFIYSCDSADDTPGPATGSSSNAVGIINDEFGGVPVVVYANGSSGSLVAFQRQTNTSSEILEFETSPSASFSPLSVFKDQNGNEYDIKGKLINGDDNVYLKQVEHVVGYWFFFPSLYQEITLNDGRQIINSTFSEGTNDWLINTDYVFSGSFRDGIPSIDQPKFVASGKGFVDHELYSNLDQNELVVVVQLNDITRVYPHRILEYHEVVNDVIGTTPITVSFCPLTGTSFAWDRTINGKVVEFGVSGLLYNNNLIMYDRSSESNWSQILGKAVSGSYVSDKASNIRMFEAKLSVAMGLPGNVEYLDTDTGIAYNYLESLYPDYRTNNQISFPLSNSNDTFSAKERVLGIVDGNKVKVYTFNDFQNQ